MCIQSRYSWLVMSFITGCISSHFLVVEGSHQAELMHTIPVFVYSFKSNQTAHLIIVNRCLAHSSLHPGLCGRTRIVWKHSYLTDGNDQGGQQKDGYRHPGDVCLEPPHLGKVTPALKLPGTHFWAREDEHLAEWWETARSSSLHQSYFGNDLTALKIDWVLWYV